MRYITPATNLGPHKVPGADHTEKMDLFQLAPGRAWKINDETRDHTVVEVDGKVSSLAKYQWIRRWIDGRSVVVFSAGGLEFAQPTENDPKARDKSLGSTRKRRTKEPRHDAPGVAPKADGSAEALLAPKDRKRRPLSIIL